VTAKADIIRVSLRCWHRGHFGFVRVLIEREKKLKMVLQSSQ
jgi:hypothetical protein